MGRWRVAAAAATTATAVAAVTAAAASTAGDSGPKTAAGGTADGTAEEGGGARRHPPSVVSPAGRPRRAPEAGRVAHGAATELAQPEGWTGTARVRSGYPIDGGREPDVMDVIGRRRGRHPAPPPGRGRAASAGGQVPLGRNARTLPRRKPPQTRKGSNASASRGRVKPPVAAQTATAGAESQSSPCAGHVPDDPASASTVPAMGTGGDAVGTHRGLFKTYRHGGVAALADAPAASARRQRGAPPRGRGS